MARDLPPEAAKVRQEILAATKDDVPMRGVAVVLAQIPPGTFTKRMLAERTGLTVHELNKLEKRKILKSVGITKRGWPYYDMTTIELLRRRGRQTFEEARAKMFADGLANGEIRKAYLAEQGVIVFRMIADGKNMRDIVLDTGFHPALVKAIHADYEDCEGGVFVPAALVREINKLDGKLDGRFPIEDAQGIFHLISRAADSIACIACRGRRGGAAVLCKACARDGAAGIRQRPNLAPYASFPNAGQSDLAAKANARARDVLDGKPVPRDMPRAKMGPRRPTGREMPKPEKNGDPPLPIETDRTG